ncbi:hypothetical protein a10_08574 [Streptomyces acidiscabies]|nr:hypothetical protein a10_08574 [Streptomyces acidiscabies]GAV45530.1 hypothetical protein Saa2_08521 [Streptomyces acidiscabies]
MPTTSRRYSPLGKYWITELMTIVSNSPSGRPVTSCAGWVRRTTLPVNSGRCSTCSLRTPIAVAEKSVAQYVSQSGASFASSRPVPAPTSRMRRGLSARMRSTVASRHSRISASGMGRPS